MTILVADMAKSQQERGETGFLFLDGFLTTLFKKGEQPLYGYPKNHLPETVPGEMEIVSGFLSEPPAE